MKVPYNVIGKSSNCRFMFFYDSLNRCLSGYPTIDFVHLKSFRLSSCSCVVCARPDLHCNVCMYEL